MIRFALRRLAIIPVALLLVHFLGFAYAHIAGPIRAARTPYIFVQPDPPPLLETYRSYAEQLLRLDPGKVPGAQESVAGVVLSAAVASAGLLAVTLVISVILGLFLGFRAVRTDPPRTSQWLTLLSTLGLAMPSFYIGTLFVVASITYILWRGPGAEPPFPIRGFGWDLHLILPVLALMVLPTMQIARVTSSLLQEELNKEYVLASRSLGYTWRAVRGRLALRNILSAVILAIAASIHVLVGELILIEWLFHWPGLGRLLGWTLIPPLLSSSSGGPLFLHPPVVAAVVTVLAAVFLISDFSAALLARIVDPRLRDTAVEALNG